MDGTTSSRIVSPMTKEVSITSVLLMFTAVIVAHEIMLSTKCIAKNKLSSSGADKLLERV